MVADMDRLMQEIDAFLLQSVDRDRFSTVEVQDMLLDLRSVLLSCKCDIIME
jgi:hypothetical protein